MFFALLGSVFYMLLWLIIPLIGVIALFWLRLSTRKGRKRGGETMHHGEPPEGGPFIEGEFIDEPDQDEDHIE